MDEADSLPPASGDGFDASSDGDRTDVFAAPGCGVTGQGPAGGENVSVDERLHNENSVSGATGSFGAGRPHVGTVASIDTGAGGATSWVNG
ncbi:hypothetical protein [Gordonia terrae]|uniref:hypothetical protein n=1 Tax=Gordonia terrae TaxID=2055 RepID=UPI0011807A8B|nr:hypothetical protein [Gordonia terrae]